MPKSYSQFKIEDVFDLGLDVKPAKLFQSKPLVEPSSWLLQTLEFHKKRPMSTEKAKSELLIVPVLIEIAERNDDFLNWFSGYNFDVEKSKGLKGHCDFLIAANSNQYVIREPVISVVEAKHENLETGIPQCIAQMYAAQIFNERKNNPISVIFGCVSYGNAWKFVRLEDKTAMIDNDTFDIDRLSELLGIWQVIIDFYKNQFQK